MPKGTKFNGVLIKSCLTKEYPDAGPFAGGIVFKRCYDMGSGIGFTKDECVGMWDGVDLDAHTMTVHAADAGDAGAAGDAGVAADAGAADVGAAADAGAADAADADAAADAASVLPGDCLEVWWDDHDTFYPCVVKEQRPDADGSTASWCRYDDDTKRYWHNLDNETCNHIEPTMGRLNRLSVRTIRARLTVEGTPFQPTYRKPVLVTLLFQTLLAHAVESDPEPPAADGAQPPAADVSVDDGILLPGDCVEVFWDDTEQFYPCVISEQAKDVGDTTASLCLYDDDADERYYHNLDNERYRRLKPTTVRLHKLHSKTLHQRLSLEQTTIAADTPKDLMVKLLLTLLTSRLMKHKPVAGQFAAKAKHAWCHKDRIATKKKNMADRTKVLQQQKSYPQAEAGRVNAKRPGYRTATQVVHDISTHAMALHTLATRGCRRDDRQDEREGYNLLTFSQTSLAAGDLNAHVWKAGEKDMTLLPQHVRSVYDCDGWECVNFYADGDGVVFKRPPAPIPVRGSGAQHRRVRDPHPNHSRLPNYTVTLITTLTGKIYLDNSHGQVVERQNAQVEYKVNRFLGSGVAGRRAMGLPRTRARAS